MKIVIAMDSFKGCLSSLEAGSAVRAAALRVFEGAEVVLCPLADGGEGSGAALVSALGGRMVAAMVHDPLGRIIQASYGLANQGALAMIEMAQSSGLTLLSPEEQNPLHTSTFGLGELIKDALDRGCRDFIIGIGGSATTDGGLGMLAALGFAFFDCQGAPSGYRGEDLIRLASFSAAKADSRLAGCRFRVACDVKNPLYGPNGAAYIFAPQKGASPQAVAMLDDGLRNYAAVAGEELAFLPGSGAAGGLGYAFARFLGAELGPGAQIILEALGMEEKLQGADIAISGEGKIDGQTAMGKAPQSFSRLAQSKGALTILIGGMVGPEANLLHQEGVDAIFPILQTPQSLKEAMDPQNALASLEKTAEEIFRLLLHASLNK